MSRDTIAPLWLWIFFVGSVLAALFVDFVMLKKQGAHAVTVKAAGVWSLIWVALSFAFNGRLWWAVAQDHGAAVAQTRALEFLTGYLIEKSPRRLGLRPVARRFKRPDAAQP